MEAIFSGGGQSAPSKSKNTAGACSWPDKTTERCQPSRSGTMCRPSTGDRGVDSWTSSLAASRAKTSPPAEKVPESKVSEADSGSRWPGSFARLDRNTRSWKTHQFSLLGGLESFSQTWPRWGMMLNGECWALATWAHVTDETESGYVPTVLTSEATGPGLHGNGSHNFRTWFRENSTQRRSPRHGEMMMLWPETWANAGAPLATDKFREWLASHGNS